MISGSGMMALDRIRLSVLTGLALVLATASMAQNEEDALRISSLLPGGTARSNGMANAFGAIGADPGSIGINPAGFGLYRNSELTLTPSLEVNDASSRFYGQNTSDSKARFYFNNLSLILHNPAKKDNEWRSGTFGVVYDRQQSHHYASRAVGKEIPSTILQRFVNEASGTSIDDLSTDAFPFSSSLAWYAYGIDPAVVDGDTLLNEYTPAIPFGSTTEQVHSVDSRGANTNTNFFYSGNYMDRLYVGISIGIASHRFKRTTKHTETSLDESLDLKDLTYTEDLNTTGNGVNAKVGVIGRITERFRMGAAFHSPQWMQLNDVYVYELKTSFRTPDADGRSSYSETSPDGAFSYRVRSPWRAALSAAYVAGKNGVISVDYEYADYAKMRFRRNDKLVDDYDFSLENAAIKQSFRAVHTIRVGMEWRAGNWYYRLGWSFVPDAYLTSDPRHGQALKTYAAGIGYRTDHVGVELGLNYSDRSATRYPYNADLVDPIREDLTNYRGLVTVSLRP